jgi:MFS family permease
MAKSCAHKQRLWTGDFTLTLAIAFCAFVSCQALNNGTPLYITRIGGTTSFAGALILDFSIAAAVARLFAGRIVDRTGRKRIMVAGALLLIAGTVLAIPLPGFYPQIVLRVLQGVGFAFVTTASATAAADVLPTERLGEGIGYYALGQSLGMAFGPAFGIFLCSLAFAESLFAGVAGVGAVLLILVMCCNYEKHVERLPETSEYRVLEERCRGGSRW